MWNMTSQKNGISALGLQRILGLGSYRTAWLMLHKLRQAMVRPGRERLRGVVEVDETYWGTMESDGATGRRVLNKAMIIVAAEANQILQAGVFLTKPTFQFGQCSRVILAMGHG
jgi:hypothetical protein